MEEVNEDWRLLVQYLELYAKFQLVQTGSLVVLLIGGVFMLACEIEECACLALLGGCGAICMGVPSVVAMVSAPLLRHAVCRAPSRVVSHGLTLALLGSRTDLAAHAVEHRWRRVRWELLLREDRLGGDARDRDLHRQLRCVVPGQQGAVRESR